MLYLDDLSKHNNAVSVKEGDARQTLARLEAFSHKTEHRLEYDFSHFSVLRGTERENICLLCLV